MKNVLKFKENIMKNVLRFTIKENIMKKMKMAILAVIAILSGALLIMGCPEDSKEPADEGYKNLVLNEVSGVGDDSEKFYELKNNGSKDISLEGWKIYYNANSGGTGGAYPPNDKRLTWTGLPEHVAKAGQYFTLIGRHNPFGDPPLDNPGSFTTGLTPVRILIITLEDPEGNEIDKCVRAVDIGIYGFTDKSFSRIPDGDKKGDFYFTTPTPDATNGTSTAGLTKVPVEHLPDPDRSTDYTKLKLNEVSGVGENSDKFYELKNTGDKNIPLNGCKIYYNANESAGGPLPNDNDKRITWTGYDEVVKPGELFSLIGRNRPAGTNPGSFTTGLTAARILIITLEDPFEREIDRCVRAADTGDYAITDKSFSRIPDGTGDFYFTEPTPDKPNGTSTDGLTKVPVRQP
jgi:hypothetical protein